MGRPAIISAEIWPSLIAVHVPPHQVKDQAQVICLAQEFRDRDRSGTIANLFAAPGAIASTAAIEEGWILGVA
jgi:hypothetical protein